MRGRRPARPDGDPEDREGARFAGPPVAERPAPPEAGASGTASWPDFRRLRRRALTGLVGALGGVVRRRSADSPPPAARPGPPPAPVPPPAPETGQTGPAERPRPGLRRGERKAAAGTPPPAPAFPAGPPEAFPRPPSPPRPGLRRWLYAALALALLVPGWFGFRILDRMALAYTTGLRRTPDAPLFGGGGAPVAGPTPGTIFLGISRPAEPEPGFVLRRVSGDGRDAGFERGDRVASVDGVVWPDTRTLAGGLIRTRLAGEVVEAEVVRGGETRTLPVTLGRFVRHPGDLGLPYDEVEFASGSGHTLRGWWIPPPETGDGRSVVWVHGAHSSRFQALDHGAELLRARGYGILTMDLSGRGSSDGEYITYTLNERHDVEASVRYLRSLAGVAPSRVVVFGTSNGAAAAIYAAAALEDLPALALDAPYADLWRTAGSTLESRGGHPALRLPLSFFVYFRTGLSIRRIRPLEAIADIPGPVLFLHGDRDTQVPPEESLELHEARLAAGLPSLRWVLPGGEHGFDAYPPKAIFWNRIADFFDDALGSRAPGLELDGPAPDTLNDPQWTNAVEP